MIEDKQATPFELLPGYALAQAFRLVRHAMDGALREVGLTTPQWAALSCVHHGGGMCGADLARVHHLTPQTVNTILHNLEGNGLIQRVPHPSHGTVLQIRLTPAGQDRLRQANQRVEPVQEAFVADLSSEERDLLCNLLGRCIQSMEAAGHSEGACPE